MVAAGMTQRWLCVLAGLGLLAGLPCCKVYDPSMLEPAPPSAGRSGGGGGVAGESAPDAAVESCVPAQEVCNDVDDDCDGMIDEAAAANEDCSSRYHASITCNRGLCLFIPSRAVCYPGWYHCDGLPENGCESVTPCLCATCDAGTDDDGGSGDDAGSVR